MSWDAERQAGLLSATLYFARTASDYEIVHDVLLRDALPAAESVRLSGRSRGAIVRELANLLAENGHATEALALYQAVDRLQPVHIADAGDMAAYLRRKYMALGAASGWARQGEAEAAYRDALAMDAGENLKVSIANSRAWTYLDLGDPKRAYDTLHPLFLRYRRVAFSPTGQPQAVRVTAWNIAELMHGFALASIAARGKRGVTLGREAFRNSTKLFALCGFRPYVVRSGYLEVQANVRALLQDLEHERLPERAALPTALAAIVDLLAQKLVILT